MLTTVLFVVVLLILTAILLFYYLQRYIVYEQDGLRLALPFLATEAAAPAEETYVPSGAVAEVEIAKPDHADMTPVSWEGLTVLRGRRLAASSLTPETAAAAAAELESAGANALVLEMKPPSGQLVWRSDVALAAAYAVSGIADFSGTVAALKEQGIYLVAEFSCCVDDLMAIRNPPLALRDTAGHVFADERGAWLDPYSRGAREYLTALCLELAAMGFDELLLTNVGHPDADVIYSREMTGLSGREAAVSNFALALTQALADTEIRVSALLETAALRAESSAVNGQSLPVFLRVFQRVYVPTDGTMWEADRALVAAALASEAAFGGDAALPLRFVPILPAAPETGSWLLS